MRVLLVVACLLPLRAQAQSTAEAAQNSRPPQPLTMSPFPLEPDGATPRLSSPVVTDRLTTPAVTSPSSQPPLRLRLPNRPLLVPLLADSSRPPIPTAQRAPVTPPTSTAPSSPTATSASGDPPSSTAGTPPADSTAPPANMPPADPQALPPLIKPDDSQAPARVDPTQLDRAYSRARTTRNVGLGLAAPGVALSILGGVVLIFTSRSQQIFTQSSQIIGGTIALAGGLALAVPGIYFWTTGQDDMDTVLWRRRQLTSLPP